MGGPIDFEEILINAEDSKEDKKKKRREIERLEASLVKVLVWEVFKNGKSVSVLLDIMLASYEEYLEESKNIKVCNLRTFEDFYYPMVDMLKDLPTEGQEAIRDYLFDLLREKFKEKNYSAQEEYQYYSELDEILKDIGI